MENICKKFCKKFCEAIAEGDLMEFIMDFLTLSLNFAKIPPKYNNILRLSAFLFINHLNCIIQFDGDLNYPTNHCKLV